VFNCWRNFLGGQEKACKEGVITMKIEPNKEFACKLGIMLGSKLIWYKHFQPFCDDIILEYTKPPYWIIELATVCYQGSAIEIVNKYIHFEPCITYYNSKHFDQYIACLYISTTEEKYPGPAFCWNLVSMLTVVKL